MQKINFVTIGDKKYFKTIDFSIKQINKFYPKAEIFVYDWGFSKKQIAVLKKNPNTTIIKWKKQFFEINIKFASFKQKIRIVHGIYNLRSLVISIIRRKFRLFNYSSYFKLIKKEMLLANKVLSFLHFARNYETNFIFLDGDAFLINKIDELIRDDFDIGVTLRRRKEINLKFGQCWVLNSGVIFFFGGSKKNRLFIEYWKEEMLKTNEYLVEQTSLSRLIYKTNQNIFKGYYKTGTLKIKEKEIKCKVFPCEIYNYNRIEEGVDKKKIKILHFKGGRHAKENLKKIIKRLKL